MSVGASDKVLIIGAGLSGLAFAQILSFHNVPYEIFERDDSPAAPNKAGWAVALVESVPEFKSLVEPSLAKDLHTNSVNHGANVFDDVSFVNARTGKVVGKYGGTEPDQPGYVLRTSRQGLRTYLWQRNNLRVTSGKVFKNYTVTTEGVTAHFEDGTSVSGSLLVGADGVHSRVLDQLLGEPHELIRSDHIPIFGEVDLTAEQHAKLQSWSKAVVLAGSPLKRLQFGLLRTHATSDANHYFWALSTQVKDRSENLKLASWIRQASREDIFAYVLELTKDWHPYLREALEHGGPQSVAAHHPTLYEYYIDSHAMPAEQRVTVIGDAAHAMVPFRGAGANTAILDACDLGRLLSKAFGDTGIGGEVDVAGVLKEYHSIMIPRGKNNVLSSRQAGAGEGEPADEWARFFPR